MLNCEIYVRMLVPSDYRTCSSVGPRATRRKACMLEVRQGSHSSDQRARYLLSSFYKLNINQLGQRMAVGLLNALVNFSKFVGEICWLRRNVLISTKKK